MFQRKQSRSKSSEQRRGVQNIHSWSENPTDKELLVAS